MSDTQNGLTGLPSAADKPKRPQIEQVNQILVAINATPSFKNFKIERAGRGRSLGFKIVNKQDLDALVATIRWEKQTGLWDGDVWKNGPGMEATAKFVDAASLEAAALQAVRIYNSGPLGRKPRARPVKKNTDGPSLPNVGPDYSLVIDSDPSNKLPAFHLLRLNKGKGKHIPVGRVWFKGENEGAWAYAHSHAEMGGDCIDSLQMAAEMLRDEDIERLERAVDKNNPPLIEGYAFIKVKSEPTAQYNVFELVQLGEGEPSTCYIGTVWEEGHSWGFDHDLVDNDDGRGKRPTLDAALRRVVELDQIYSEKNDRSFDLEKRAKRDQGQRKTAVPIDLRKSGYSDGDHDLVQAIKLRLAADAEVLALKLADLNNVRDEVDEISEQYVQGMLTRDEYVGAILREAGKLK